MSLPLGCGFRAWTALQGVADGRKSLHKARKSSLPIRARAQPPPSQGKANCTCIEYMGNTGGIQGAYRGYTGGKLPAWEVIGTQKPPQRHLKAGSKAPFR